MGNGFATDSSSSPLVVASCNPLVLEQRPASPSLSTISHTGSSSDTSNSDCSPGKADTVFYMPVKKPTPHNEVESMGLAKPGTLWLVEQLATVVRSMMTCILWFGIPQWICLCFIIGMAYVTHFFFEWARSITQTIISSTAEASAIYGSAAVAKGASTNASTFMGSWIKQLIQLKLMGSANMNTVAVISPQVEWWQDPFTLSIAFIGSALASVTSCFNGPSG